MKRKTVPPQSAADPSMLLRQAQAQLEQADRDCAVPYKKRMLKELERAA